MFKTIAAISSGVINQPISIIRLSGSDAFDIASKIFTGKTGTDKTITYGNIVEGDTVIDEVLVNWFKGPHTFTGEDIVEINAHGGVINSQKILQLLLANGAIPAEPGEFSRRAFLNGKMDLVKAEAIHDLIFAKTSRQAQLSVKKFDGKTSSLINDLKEDLLTIIATCETNIDYPEYDDVEQLSQENLIPKLKEVSKKINLIKKSSESSRFIFEGIKVAIVGKPNAGKSSLLNALLNEDKAIVTDVPGTTRDVVEGQVVIGNVLLNLNDTAGIRNSDNKIEMIGIDKSFNQIDAADLVIHVVDSTEGESEEDASIKNKVGFKEYIKVFNKSDIKEVDGISISAKEKDITQLTDKIVDTYKDITLDESLVINNSRQLGLIAAADIAIIEAIDSLNNGMTPDTVIVDIQKAWEDLANILGKADHSDLLDNMFSNFCLGK